MDSTNSIPSSPPSLPALPSLPSSGHRLFAEMFGTFVLVLGGCGSAVLSAKFPGTGIGFLGVALAFGLSVLVSVYAFGGISGGHFNPAITFGLCVAKKFSWKELPGYVGMQLLGSLVASLVLLLIARGQPGGFTGSLAANGYGAHSPGGFGLGAGFLAEVVLTCVFVLVVVGATARGSHVGFAGLAIGLALTLIHLISIPVTNTSVNPARSTGPALFSGAAAVGQLWMFWLAPLIGAAIAGGVGAWLFADEPASKVAKGARDTRRLPAVPVN